jgi:hypothetical protein
MRWVGSVSGGRAGERCHEFLLQAGQVGPTATRQRGLRSITRRRRPLRAKGQAATVLKPYYRRLSAESGPRDVEGSERVSPSSAASAAAFRLHSSQPRPLMPTRIRQRGCHLSPSSAARLTGNCRPLACRLVRLHWLRPSERVCSLQPQCDVATHERGGAFPERPRRGRPGIAPRQVRLDDAIEHRDQRRPFPVQRVGCAKSDPQAARLYSWMSPPRRSVRRSWCRGDAFTSGASWSLGRRCEVE